MAKGFEIFFFHFLEDCFQVKNVESIHAWHPEKKNSCKTQNFSLRDHNFHGN